MNFIYEDEDFDPEFYLTDKDYYTFRRRRDSGKNREKCLSFSPKYRIRPTVDQVFFSRIIYNIFQVIQKLNEFYDMSAVDDLENLPEQFEKQSEFFLPEGDFSELLQKRVNHFVEAIFFAGT